jgi:hypothetical protein
MSIKLAIPMVRSDRKIIENARRTVPFEISLFDISILSSPLAMLIKFIQATANVLVFIPPPVEAGDAPIHIRSIVINKVGSANEAISNELKPAVLGVTEPKNAITHFPIGP